MTTGTPNHDGASTANALRKKQTTHGMPTINTHSHLINGRGRPHWQWSCVCHGSTWCSSHSVNSRITGAVLYCSRFASWRPFAIHSSASLFQLIIQKDFTVTGKEQWSTIYSWYCITQQWWNSESRHNTWSSPLHSFDPCLPVLLSVLYLRTY